METSPRKVEGLSEIEVLDLCRSEVETMHNVHYLMSCADVPRDTMQRYLADMSRSHRGSRQRSTQRITPTSRNSFVSREPKPSPN